MALGSLNFYCTLSIRNQVSCVSCWRDSLQNREGKSKSSEVVNFLSAEMPHLTELVPCVLPLGKSTTNWSQFCRWEQILISPGAAGEICDSWAFSGHQSSMGTGFIPGCAGGSISAHWAMQAPWSDQGNGVMVTAGSQPQSQQIQALLKPCWGKH